MNIVGSDLKFADLSKCSQTVGPAASDTITDPKGESEFQKLVKACAAATVGTNNANTKSTEVCDKQSTEDLGTSKGLAANISKKSQTELLKKTLALLGKMDQIKDTKLQGSDTDGKGVGESKLLELIRGLLSSLNNLIKEGSATQGEGEGTDAKVKDGTKDAGEELMNALGLIFQLMSNKQDPKAAQTQNTGSNKDGLKLLMDNLSSLLKASDTDRKAQSKQSTENPDLNVMLLLLINKLSLNSTNEKPKLSKEAVTGVDKPSQQEVMQLLLKQLDANLGSGTSNTLNNLNSKGIKEILLQKLNGALENPDTKELVKKDKALQNELQQLLDQLNSGALEVDEKSQPSGKLNQDNTELTASSKSIINDLNSILETVKAKADTNDSINVDKDLKAAFEELVAQVDLNQLKSSDASKGSVKNLAVDTKPVVATEDFKSKLVELLVALTKDSLKTDEKTTDNKVAQRFARLVNQALKPEDTTKATTGNLSSTLNSESVEVAKADMMKDPQNTKLATSKENKVLNSVMGKEDDNSSKMSKVNTFIAQLNSSKDQVQTTSSKEEPIITRANFTEDLVKVVKFMNLNDQKELTVKIAPKELGEITIKLTMEEGNLKANISANNKDTFNLLSSNLKEITNSLNNNDIRIQNVDINIYQGDTTFFNNNSNRGNGQGQTKGNGNKTSEEFADLKEIQLDINGDENNISALA